jgi:hypothetical protein
MTARATNARYAALAGFVAGLLVAGATIPLALNNRGGAPAADVLSAGVGPATDGSLPGAPGSTLPGAPGDPLAPGGPGALPGSGGLPTDPGSGAVAPGVGQPGSGSGSAPGAGPAGAPGAPGGAPGAQPGSAGSAPLTASDRGVTAKAVKVGFGIVTAGNVDLEEAGFGVKAQRDTWQAFVDEVNRTGGVNGRTVAPVYRQYDVLNADSNAGRLHLLDAGAKVFTSSPQRSSATRAMPDQAEPHAVHRQLRATREPPSRQSPATTSSCAGRVGACSPTCGCGERRRSCCAARRSASVPGGLQPAPQWTSA